MLFFEIVRVFVQFSWAVECDEVIFVMFKKNQSALKNCIQQENHSNIKSVENTLPVDGVTKGH